MKFYIYLYIHISYIREQLAKETGLSMRVIQVTIRH